MGRNIGLKVLPTCEVSCCLSLRNEQIMFLIFKGTPHRGTRQDFIYLENKEPTEGVFLLILFAVNIVIYYMDQLILSFHEAVFPKMFKYCSL